MTQEANFEMSLQTRLYISLVISLGTLALGFGLYHWEAPDLLRFLCYLALAIPASCLKVALPGVSMGTMSVLFLFLLGGIVELNLPETLVIGAVCVAAQSLWHSKFGVRLVQLVFSVANIAVAITATDFAYRVIPLESGPVRLAIAVSVFFVLNTFPIAIVIALTEKKSVRQVWTSSYLWCFPYYLVGAGVVSVIKFSNRMLDWQAGLLILPVVYVVYRSYRLYLTQLQRERNRAEEEHRHAAEIAALHAETVEALASAMTANARLDAVFRASPLAFLTLDREGRVTGWNATAERIFGWSSEEVVGLPLPLATGQSEEIIHGIFERTLQGELILGLEMEQWRKDGSPFSAAIWTATLRVSEGVSGVLVTVADVSIRKRLEDELRLSQKMEAIGLLAGGVAHDFNNLLTAIIGYNGFLMESLTHEPKLLGYGREVQLAAERAAALTRQLLTFGRRQVSKPKLLNLNEGVTNIRNLLARVIGEDIEIVTNLQPDLGSTRVDPVELDQIIMNLAVNARDAMPDGGRLTFETANVTVSPAEAHETLSTPGEYTMLRVRDTGSGIDAETKSRLFEPFFTTKEQGKGTGLGLSIIYGVVQQNGGFIAVDSEVGAGATFSVYFPRCRDAEGAGTSTSAPVPPGAAGGATVLLVEDDPIVRRLASALLCAQGYRILEASTPAEAIEIEGGYPDPIRLLLTDVLMPGMRGNELAERLRELRPGLPVLYMSGYSDSTFLSPGALEDARFLQKPFVAEELVRAVGEALQGASGAAPKRA